MNVNSIPKCNKTWPHSRLVYRTVDLLKSEVDVCLIVFRDIYTIKVTLSIIYIPSAQVNI